MICMTPTKVYTTEAALTKAVKKWLDTQQDVFYWKASDRYTSGVPDIIACVHGKFLGLELKDATGVVSAPQRLFQRKITKAHGLWAEVRTVQDAMDAVQKCRENK